MQQKNTDTILVLVCLYYPLLRFYEQKAGTLGASMENLAHISEPQVPTNDQKDP